MDGVHKIFPETYANLTDFDWNDVLQKVGKTLVVTTSDERVTKEALKIARRPPVVLNVVHGMFVVFEGNIQVWKINANKIRVAAQLLRNRLFLLHHYWFRRTLIHIQLTRIPVHLSEVHNNVNNAELL